jgi:hypothetical protein
MASSEGRFLVEADGVTAITATEATVGGLKHTPHKHQPGNQPNPTLGRGNFEVEEMSFKHATAVGAAGAQLRQWLMDYARGLTVQKRNFRFIVMDEAGRVPVETTELLDCVPTLYKPEPHTGSGTNVSQFSFSLLPTDMRVV